MDVKDGMAHRLLRVVLVFHGEPLEERAFPLEERRFPGVRRPVTVTLGQEGHDTFTIPACPLPPSFPLLRAAGDEFVLRLSEGMVGQLCLTGEAMTVQDFFTHRRGIAVSAVDSEVSALVLREHVLGPGDWGIVATESTGAVALFFQYLPPQQRDLRPRSTPLLSWLPGLPGLPFGVDRFLLQGLALAVALTGLVLGPSLLGWEPDDSLALTPPLPLRLVRLLPREQQGPASKEPPDRHGARQGIAEKLVAERLQPREKDRRPLLSDDPPAPEQPPPQPDAAAPAPVPVSPSPPPQQQPPPAPQRRGPEVLSGSPASPGPLTPLQLDQTVSRHQDELTFCYRQELKRQPGLSGRLLVVWNIDATGAVTRVNISGSTLYNSALEACVAHAIQSWRFPAARGLTLGATVPLVFRD